ncbi:MAG: response regulator [Magnetovibrionaceae bacterium]
MSADADTSDASSINAQIAVLRQAFTEKLPSRVDELLALGDDPSALEREDHRLKGAAAMFGLNAISDAAKVLERAAAAGGGLDDAFLNLKVRAFEAIDGPELASEVSSEEGGRLLLEGVLPEGLPEALDAAGLLGPEGEPLLRLARVGKNPKGAEKDRALPLLGLLDEDGQDQRLDAARAGALAVLIQPAIPEIVERVEALLGALDQQNAKILVVDDDPVVSEVYQAVLKNAGYQVRWLQSPEKIVAAVDDFDPELVLMDQSMPGLTGGEATALLRQFDRFQTLPVVFLSGETGPEVQARVIALGADGFLNKKLSPGALVQACSAWIRRRRLR